MLLIENIFNFSDQENNLVFTCGIILENTWYHDVSYTPKSLVAVGLFYAKTDTLKKLYKTNKEVRLSIDDYLYTITPKKYEGKAAFTIVRELNTSIEIYDTIFNIKGDILKNTSDNSNITWSQLSVLEKRLISDISKLEQELKIITGIQLALNNYLANKS